MTKTPAHRRHDISETGYGDTQQWQVVRPRQQAGQLAKTCEAIFAASS
jgi:hypothetical protein